MSKKQYLRLTLVLLIPLLAMGLWFVRSDVILPNHYKLFSCGYLLGEFRCSGRLTKVKGGSYIYSNGTFINNAYLYPLVPASIIAWDIPSPSTNRFDGEVESSQKNVREMLLTDDMYPKPKDSIEKCILDKLDGNKGEWRYYCTASHSFDFKFKDDVVNDEYLKLFDLSKDTNDRLNREIFDNKVTSFFVPIVVYFLISLALFLLIKIVRFVSTGGFKKSA
jgi:hypothetical protein